jgi:hypothetical protein
MGDGIDGRRVAASRLQLTSLLAATACCMLWQMYAGEPSKL